MRMRLAVPLCIPRRAGWTTAARALGICLVMAMSACGGSNSNPAGASGGTGSGSTGGSGSGTSNKTVTVTIDGVAFVPTLVTAVRSNPGVETVTIAATNAAGASGTTTTFAAPALVGVHAVNATVTDRGYGDMTILSGATSAGYLAFLTSGSGSVTISLINTGAVAGRVDLVMAPTGVFGPNKTVSGTFNVAF